MPRSQFMKLSEVKKNKIITCAQEEFVKNGYETASINQIIKNAGIARGSFYNYFEDKADIYYYIVEEYRQKITDLLYKSIIDMQGDIFKGYSMFFQKITMLNIFSSSKIFQKLVDDILENGFLSLINNNKNVNAEDFLKNFLKIIDLKKLKINSSKDLYAALDLMTMITMQHIKHLENKKFSKDQITEIYTKQLKLISCGLEKK